MTIPEMTCRVCEKPMTLEEDKVTADLLADASSPICLDCLKKVKPAIALELSEAAAIAAE